MAMAKTKQPGQTAIEYSLPDQQEPATSCQANRRQQQLVRPTGASNKQRLQICLCNSVPLHLMEKKRSNTSDLQPSLSSGPVLKTSN